MPSAGSATPPHFPPRDNSSESADCTFLADILSTETFLEHPEVEYGNSRFDIDRGRYHHHGRELSTECGCKFSVRAEENSAFLGHPTAQTQFCGTPSGEFAFLVPGNQRDRIFYTDDANVKLTDYMRRQCFNCNATETSTWRRSLLNAGKMVRGSWAICPSSAPLLKIFPRSATSVDSLSARTSFRGLKNFLAERPYPRDHRNNPPCIRRRTPPLVVLFVMTAL